MAEYIITKGFTTAALERQINTSNFAFNLTNHKRVIRIEHSAGVNCACGGQAQSVTVAVTDKLIYTASSGGAEEELATSNIAYCHPKGTGPTFANNMATTVFDFGEGLSDEDNGKILDGWRNGRLKLVRVLKKTNGSSASGTPKAYISSSLTDTVAITCNNIPYTNYNPQILHFDAWRYSDSINVHEPSGTKIGISYKLAKNAGGSPSCTVSVRDSSNIAIGTMTISSININSNNDTKIALTIPNVTFSADEDYYLTMVFTCNPESSTMEVLVPRNRLPIHISSSNSGVAIGGRSTATSGVPKFEIGFPIILTTSNSYGTSDNMPLNPSEGQLYFVVE